MYHQSRSQIRLKTLGRRITLAYTMEPPIKQLNYDMIYTADPVFKVLPRLNTSWFLPALQREFVWGADRICNFFDSLMRSYPVGAFLLWRVPDEAREEGLEVYRFIDSASDIGKHNTRERVFGIKDLTFVLDGQQRLASLLIGLKGSYEVRKKYARTGEAQRLHLNILRDGQLPDQEGEISYGFDFRPNSATLTRGTYWFEVARILRYENNLDAILKETTDRLKALHVSEAELQTANDNLRALHRVVYSDHSICYHTETHGDQERMLDIFIRANSGGEPLSKAELLLSNLTVHWKARDARAEVTSFVDEINDALNLGADSSRKVLKQDFVLKSCLTLLDSPIAYRISSFSKSACEQIEIYWSEIQNAIKQTVEIANWFGINGLNLTSANALIPVAYYLYRNPEARLRSDSKTDAENASLVRRWLIMALLNGIFSGSSDTMLTRARSVIVKHGEHGRLFPVHDLDFAARDLRRLPTNDPNAIKKILEIEYGDNAATIALSLLFEERAWGTIPHHLDHIFPQALFKESLRQYRSGADQLGNLTLLNARENLEKKAKPFDEWMQTREPFFITRHLIPNDKKLWRPEAYPDFLQERNRLILDRLYQVLGAE